MVGTGLSDPREMFAEEAEADMRGVSSQLSIKRAAQQTIAADLERRAAYRSAQSLAWRISAPSI
jgi:hypothetical protein